MVENRMIERSFFFYKVCYNYFQQELMKEDDDVSKVNDLKKENQKMSFNEISTNKRLNFSLLSIFLSFLIDSYNHLRLNHTFVG